MTDIITIKPYGADVVGEVFTTVIEQFAYGVIKKRTFVDCDFQVVTTALCFEDCIFDNCTFSHRWRNQFVRGRITNSHLPSGGTELSTVILDRTNTLLGRSIVNQAHVQFSKHGESGRTLAAYALEGNYTVFSCGCFFGGEDELVHYINKGSPAYCESRHLALKYVKELLCV